MGYKQRMQLWIPLLNVLELDFPKAFDKAPHQRFLSKLRSHGIREKVLSWLKNVKQSVGINSFHTGER